MNKRPGLYTACLLKSIGLLALLLLNTLVTNTSTTDAYQLTGVKWPQPSTTFYIDIPGADGLWNEAFEGAMYEWGSTTVFQYYIVRGSYSDPCDPDDERNGVRFCDTNCGDAWGSTTLAICTWWYVDSTIVETDIVFNSNESWDVYSSPWWSGSWYGVNDFRRVAVHELGHALGLGHEDSGLLTIMRSYTGDVTTPQQDDINGVSAIYGESECTYSISPSSGSFTSGSGSKSVSVTASGSSCSWTTSENLAWVNLSPTSGIGSRSVTVSVTANTGAARSGSITIAGKTYTVSQEAEPCTYSISPTSDSFTSGSGTKTISVTTSSPSCSWTTSESLSWVSLSPASGTGNASVTVSVTANTGEARSGTITIADQTYTISQQNAACTYSVSPSSGRFTSGSGSKSVSVTASGSSCSWTTSENLAWVNLSPTSGIGSRSVTVSVTANTGAARNGTITIAGQAYTISQAAGVLIRSITVLTNTYPNHTVTSGSDEKVYGTATSNQIILESGAKAELINFPGQNYIQFQSNADLFAVSLSGTVVTFQGSDGSILKIPATRDIQTISFNGEQSRVLQIHNNQVMLDDQVIGLGPQAIY